MATHTEKKSQARMLTAVSLFFASIVVSFIFALLSNQGSSYWVIRDSLPKGAQIGAENVGVVKIKLSRATAGYLPGTLSPIGAVSRRALVQGEILHRSALTDSSDQLTSEGVSLAIRPADLPASVGIGDIVSIYQLHDARNGENLVEPRIINPSVFIKEISGREGNFRGELTVTVALSREKVPALLAATTSGRLVIVATSG